MSELKNFLWRHRILAFFIVTTGIAASIMEGFGLSLVIPLFEGIKGAPSQSIPFPLNQISQLLNHVDFSRRVQIVAVLMVITTMIKGAMVYLSSVLTYRLQTMVVKHYRMVCFDQLMTVGMGYIHAQRNAFLQTIAINHTQNLGALINIVGTLIPKIFTILVLLAMLTLLSWKMTVVSFLLVVLASLVLWRIVYKAEIAGKNLTRTDKEINNAALDVILGMKVIRLFSREQQIRKRFEGEVDRFNSNYFQLARTHGSVQPIFETTGIGSLALILVMGSFFLARSGSDGLEAVLTFILIFFRLLSPAMAVNQARVAIAGDLPYYREVHRFIEKEDKPYIGNGTRIFKGFRHTIELRDIDFQYRPGIPVLQDVSFRILKGMKVGIVGPSGAGKSTIAELLLRFYDPQKGEIAVDGVNLKEFDVHAWRRAIGMVTQDIFLFNDTIRNNIAFAKPEAALEEIEEAARKAYAHEFIQALPQGYETVIGDRGVLLSGGQRQRIAIARAILTDPEILLFDEATSALDTESEEIVQKALQEVGEGKTVIAIAHRLSTVSDSDLIIVLDQGRVLEQGTHQELMHEEDGFYRRLVSRQTLEPTGDLSG